jgi:hypothetical protein
MKRLFHILLILLLGVGTGSLVAVLRTRAVPWQGYTTGGPNDPAQIARRVTSERASRLEVPVRSHDFGVMDMDREGRHEFVFRNVGQDVLRLSKGSTSCGCTLSQVDQTEIAPGQSAKVVVQWKAKKNPGVYQETATILTNDPAQPRVVLTVSGRMVPALEVVPSELSLGQLSVSQAAEGEVRVFGFRPEALVIGGFQAAEAASADWFSAVFSPLSSEEIREKADARSGVRVQIKVKSGLPLGAIRQTIKLTTNYRDRPPVEIPIEGMVTSDISLFGEGWNAETNVLSLGTINGRTGRRKNVVIVARGPRSKLVDFRLVEARPRLLKVELGKTLRMKDRPVAQAVLSVEVPPNTPAANFIGSGDAPMGQIVIETNHPQVPRLRISVSFLIEG